MELELCLIVFEAAFQQNLLECAKELQNPYFSSNKLYPNSNCMSNYYMIFKLIMIRCL